MKNEDQLKSIELSDEDPVQIRSIQQFLDRLEVKDLSFHYCRLCECILSEDVMGEAQQLSDKKEESKEEQES